MTLFQAELRKLLSSRVLIGILLVLLISNFGLAYRLPAVSDRDVVVREVYGTYLDHRAEMDAYYTELEELHRIYIKEDDPPIPYTYSGTPAFNDYEVLRAVKEKAAYFDTYGERLSNVIEKAEKQIEVLHGYGYSDRTYTTRSQILIRDTYQALSDTICLDGTYSYGYDAYLQYDAVSLFVILFLTTAVSYIFLHDETVGFHAILQTARRGRLHTVTAKLLTSVTVCIAATLLFLLTAFLGVGLKVGYSTPFTDIQTFEAFALVPRVMTVMEYFAVHTAMRLLGFLVYTLFLAAIASTKVPYVICYSAGLCFSGINAFLFYRNYTGTVPQVKYLNLGAMAEGCELLASYRTADVFRIPVEMPMLLLAVSAVLILFLWGIASLLFCKNFRKRLRSGTVFSGLREKILAPIRARHRKKRSVRLWRLPLWGFELKKNSALITLLLVLLLLLAKIGYTDATVGDMKSFGEALYYEYVTEAGALEGEAREHYLTKERAEINAILDRYGAVKEAYYSKKITSEEYSAYMQTYYAAQAKDTVFHRVENYASYLARKNASTGYSGEMIYTSGLEAFFSLSADFFLYAALMLLCYRVFTVEYAGTVSSGSFAQLLRSTRKGRECTFRTKFVLYLSISAVLGAVFRVVTFFTVRGNYIMPPLSANLYSVERFSAVTTDVGILEYLFVDILLAALAATVTATAVLGLSFFLKKPFAVLAVALIATGLPEIITETVLPRFSDFSILSLTSPQGIYCSSAEKQWFSLDCGYLICLCLLYLAVAVILTSVAWRQYNGKTLIRQKGGNRV